MLRFPVTILAFMSVLAVASGQTDSSVSRNDTLRGKIYFLPKVERNGVTLPEVEIKEVDVIAHPGGTGTGSGMRKRDYRRYERLIYNIKKVYPYAKIVRSRLEKVNEDLKKITDEKARKKYIRNVEKDVFAEYEDDIRKMTITQGRLLIKLIDRETSNTSYDLIRDYRGKLSASFWQGIARIFGTNLKEEYDAYGDDILIELIINEIDAGTI